MLSVAGRSQAEPGNGGRPHAAAPPLYFGARLAAKAGESPQDCQDAWWVNPTQMRVAVADGAARSLFPREWAWLLVRAFCGIENGAVRLPTSAAEWQRWLDGPREQWIRQVRERIERSPNRLLLHNRVVQRHPAAATLAGLVLTPAHGEVRWESTTLGDTCILHFSPRGVVSHPVSRSAQFDSHPLALLSVPDPRRERIPTVCHGTAAPGDLLVLATDALAKYLLAQSEGRKDVRRMVLEWMADENEASFAARLARARDFHAAGGGISPLYLEDDDITLVVISVCNPYPGLRLLEQAVPPSIPAAAPAPGRGEAVGRQGLGGFSDDWLATSSTAAPVVVDSAAPPTICPSAGENAARDDGMEFQMKPGPAGTALAAPPEQTSSLADGLEVEADPAGADVGRAPRRVWRSRPSWLRLPRYTRVRVLALALAMSLAGNVYLLLQDQGQPGAPPLPGHAETNPGQDTDVQLSPKPVRLAPGTLLFSAPGQENWVFRVVDDSLAPRLRAVPNGWSEVALEGWVRFAQEDGAELVVRGDTVNLRESASASSRLLGRLPPGARLEKLDERDNWYHVRLRSFARPG